MIRRRHNLYVNKLRPSKPLRGQESTISSNSLNTNPIAVARVPVSNPIVPIKHQNSYSSNSSRHSPGLRFGLEIARLKKLLGIIAGLTSLFSWVVTIFGYFVITETDQNDPIGQKDCLKIAVLMVSLLQASLIVPYWHYNLRYLELTRSAYRLSPRHIKRLRKSSLHLLQCVLEVSYHLIVFIPKVNFSEKIYVFSSFSELSLDYLIYMLILFRNYHSFQALYWFSHASDGRTHFFTNVANVQEGVGFVFRYSLAEFTLKLVFGLYGFIVIIPGILVFLFDEGEPATEVLSVWNGFWLVAYTQSTVGYGDMTAVTFFGQVTLVISCFIGIFILAIVLELSRNEVSLNLTECTVYSELLYRTQKRKYEKSAVLMIQKWWRFMLHRMRHIQNAQTTIDFYSHLLVYRGVITTCQRVKDRRFERQIQAFADSTSKKFRATTEYFSPIYVAAAYVSPTQTLDMLRTQYNIKMKTKALRRFPYKAKPVDRTGSLPETRRKQSIGSEASSRSRSQLKQGKILAKRQNVAYQNLKGRLLKQKTAVSTLLE